MFWCVPGTIGKVFHEVLLKIFEVFFVEPSILLKAKGIFSKSFYVEKKCDARPLLVSPVHPGAPSVVPVFLAVAE